MVAFSSRLSGGVTLSVSTYTIAPAPPTKRERHGGGFAQRERATETLEGTKRGREFVPASLTRLFRLSARMDRRCDAQRRRLSSGAPILGG